MMKILVNNQETHIVEPLLLDQLVALDGIVTSSHFAIAVNETFVPKTQYGDVMIQDGDRVEVLAPMQGG